MILQKIEFHILYLKTLNERENKKSTLGRL
jgi:hypothetical protein